MGYIVMPILFNWCLLYVLSWELKIDIAWISHAICVLYHDNPLPTV